MAFTDDFNRSNSATVGNGWIEETPACFEILNNKLRGHSNSANFFNNQLKRPASEAFADGVIRVDFQYVTDTSGVPQLHGRAQGANDNTFYLCFVVNGTDFRLAYSSNGSINYIQQANGAFNLSIGVNYRLELKMQGSTISAKLTNLDTQTVISSLSGTHSGLPGSGKQAISVGAGGNPIDYDNFYAGLADNAVTVTESGVGADSVTQSVPVTSKTVTDAGAGAEALGLSAALQIADTSLGADLIKRDPPKDQLVLLERFMGTLAAWTLDQSGGTVSIQTVDNDEKMVLDDTSATGLVSATRSFEAPDGVFIVEADMYALSGAVGRLELLDASNNVLMSVTCDGGAGQGSFTTDLGTASTFSWPAATYKMVVIRVDTTRSEARCFYTTGNGQTPSNWTSVSAAKSFTRGAVVSKIRFITDTAATGAIRVDEVKVYRADLFALGDSITAGHGLTLSSVPEWNPNPADSTSRQRTNEDETHSWPYRLGQKYTPAVWVANRGVDADETGDAKTRLSSDIIDQGAKRCVVMLGTNDIRNNTPLSTAESNISSIASTLASNGIEVVLCSIPPSNQFNATQNANKASLNSYIQNLCTTNGYAFVDIHSVLEDPNNLNNLLPAYDAGDGLHLSNSGLQAVADEVYSIIGVPKAADVGVAQDSVSVSVTLGVGDAGSGLDVNSLLEVLLTADVGSGADSLSLYSYYGTILKDAGLGTDAVKAMITGGATIQDVYDLVAKRPVLADIEGSAILAKQAKLDFIEKWILNKLVENPPGTFTLYDDDGVTVLKTWVWDSNTKTRSKAV